MPPGCSHQPWKGSVGRGEAGGEGETAGMSPRLMGAGELGSPPPPLKPRLVPSWAWAVRLTALLPIPREPDSTYFDLPQASQSSSEGACGAEASMDFHLPGMAASSVMVSGVAVCRGLGDRVGRECGLSCPGSLRKQETGSLRTPWGCQGILTAKQKMYQLT